MVLRVALFAFIVISPILYAAAPNSKAEVLRSDKEAEQIPGLSISKKKLKVKTTKSQLQQVTLTIRFKAEGRTFVADELIVKPTGSPGETQELKLQVTLTAPVTPIFMVATDASGVTQEEKILISFPEWKEPPPQPSPTPTPVPSMTPEPTPSPEPPKEVEPVKDAETESPPVAASDCRAFSHRRLAVGPILGFEKLEVYDKTNGNDARYVSNLRWGVHLAYSRALSEKFEPEVFLDLSRYSFKPGDKSFDHGTGLLMAFGFAHSFHLGEDHRFHVTPYVGYIREPFVRAMSQSTITLQPVGLFTLGGRGSYDVFASNAFSGAVELGLGTFIPRSTDDINISSGFITHLKFLGRYNLEKLQLQGALNIGANRFSTSASTQSRVFMLLEFGVHFNEFFFD